MKKAEIDGRLYNNLNPYKACVLTFLLVILLLILISMLLILGFTVGKHGLGIVVTIAIICIGTANTQFETEDTYASYRMVEAGLGVSLSNYIESKERSSGENVCLIELDPPQIVEIGVITHMDEVISPVARKFREFVMGYIEDIIK